MCDPELLQRSLNKLDNLAEELRRTRALVKFLARTYGDNDPVFYFNDLYGHELTQNKELAETWDQVVRGRSSTPLGVEVGNGAGNKPDPATPLEGTQ